MQMIHFQLGDDNREKLVILGPPHSGTVNNRPDPIQTQLRHLVLAPRLSPSATQTRHARASPCNSKVADPTAKAAKAHHATLRQPRRAVMTQMATGHG